GRAARGEADAGRPRARHRRARERQDDLRARRCSRPRDHRPGDEPHLHHRPDIRRCARRAGGRAHRPLQAALAERRGPGAARRLSHARADRLRGVAGGGGARAGPARRARTYRAPRRRRPPHRDRRAVTVLGFDTSTAASSACVLRADGEAFEVVPPDAALSEPPAHARELMPAIAEVMERAGVDFGDLDALAVGVGPGTFTGLRIGVATARALAHANGLGVHPVSSLAALAEGIDAELRLPLIDAKRGELFAALYDGGAERWPPFAATPEALIER